MCQTKWRGEAAKQTDRERGDSSSLRLLNSLLELPFHFGKTEERTVAFQKEEWRRGEIALADLSIGQEDIIAILSIRPNLKQHI